MSNLGDLNMDGVTSGGDFGLLPAGWYAVVAEDSDRREAKSGNGDYLNMRFKIAEGEYQNRTVFYRFNLWNRNEKASQIAKKQWKGFIDACDVDSPGDSSHLHGIKVLANVIVQKGTNGYSDSNDIRGFKPVGGFAPAPAAAPAAPAPAPQAAPEADETSPW